MQPGPKVIRNFPFLYGIYSPNYPGLDVGLNISCIFIGDIARDVQKRRITVLSGEPAGVSILSWDFAYNGVTPRVQSPKQPAVNKT